MITLSTPSCLAVEREASNCEILVSYSLWSQLLTLPKAEALVAAERARALIKKGLNFIVWEGCFVVGFCCVGNVLL